MRLHLLVSIGLCTSATSPSWVAAQSTAIPTTSCQLPAPLVCPPQPPPGPKTASPDDKAIRDPDGSTDTGRRVASGAAIGGVVGAATGAVVGGVSPVEGALVGAVLGGVAGAIIKGRQYYRDTRGYCYYVDQYGNPIYKYDVRC